MTNLEKRLLALQQKIESLSAEVADLVALTSDSTLVHTFDTHTSEAKPVAKRKTTTAQIGLNRYRQLVEESV